VGSAAVLGLSALRTPFLDDAPGGNGGPAQAGRTGRREAGTGQARGGQASGPSRHDARCGSSGTNRSAGDIC
jgi:hypothetical protein